MQKLNEFAMLIGSPLVNEGFGSLLTDPTLWTAETENRINRMHPQYRATYLCPLLLADTPGAQQASDKIAAQFHVPPLRLKEGADARMWLRRQYRDMLYWNSELHTLLNEAGDKGEKRESCKAQLSEILRTKGLQAFADEFLSMRDPYKDDPSVAVLTEEQMKVLDPLAPGENMIIAAGPGAGKTYTLISLMEDLIYEKGLDPSEITVISFTNTAANELRQRFMAENPQLGFHIPHISTVDSLALSIVRKYAPDLLPEKMRSNAAWTSGEAGKHILQGDDMENRIWSQVIDIMVDEGTSGVERRGLLLNDLATSVNRVRVNDWDEEELFRTVNSNLVTEKEIRRGGELFAEIKKKEGLVDFVDIRNLALKAMDDPIILLAVQKTCKVTITDEYQDNNLLQKKIVKKMTPENGNRIAAGDDDQNVYNSLGARHGDIVRESREPDTVLKVIAFLRRYKNRRIPRAAETFIKNTSPDRIAKEYRLSPDVPEGEKPSLIMCERESTTNGTATPWDNEFRTHFSLIADRLEKAATEEERRNIAASTVILCRTNEQVGRARQMLTTLPEYAGLIKYMARKGSKKNTKGIINAHTPSMDFATAFLESFGNNGSEEEFNRLLLMAPGRNIPSPWEKRSDRLAPDWDRAPDEPCIDAYRRWIERQGIVDGPAVTFLESYEAAGQESLAAESVQTFMNGYPRMDDPELASLVYVLHENAVPSNGWPSFRDDILAHAAAQTEKVIPGIRIMTMHKSKGMEFDYVYAMGLGRSDDVATRNPFAPKEVLDDNNVSEAMLEFVALTRAKEEFYGTGSDRNGLFNSRMSSFYDTVDWKISRRLNEEKIHASNRKNCLVPPAARFEVDCDKYNTESLSINGTDVKKIAPPTEQIGSVTQEKPVDDKKSRQPTVAELTRRRPAKTSGKTY